MTQSSNTANSSDVGSVSLAGSSIEGDFFNSTTYTTIQQEQDFSSINLDMFRPHYFPRPSSLEDHLSTLKAERILVLHSPRIALTRDLASHFAWHIASGAAANSAGTGMAVTPTAMRWKPNPDTTGLKLKLLETVEPTVFVLPMLALKHVREYTLKNIQDTIAGRHYVIISTDGDDTWKREKNQPYWYYCDVQVLFDKQSLCRAFIERLTEKVGQLPAKRLPEDIVESTRLDGVWTVWAVAQQLREPREIQAVIDQLVEIWKQRERPSPGELDDLIKKVRAEADIDPETQVRDRYHKLDPREQLLALNLSFFPDLYEDQCFSAIERMVTQIWRARDPQLPAFDYNDVHKLQAFFSFDNAANQGSLRLDSQHGRIIRTQVPNQRTILLQLAWENQRRQIVAALPVLTDFIHRSARRDYDDFSLYPTTKQRGQLRDAIGETLSDIGLIDGNAVLEVLIYLATDNHLEVQAVAADAITRWRMFGRDDQVFGFLKGWWDAAVQKELRDLVESILDGRKSEKRHPSEDYVRATVALAIGFASQYDSENDLAAPLIDMLVLVSKDTSTLVRTRFQNYTLPKAVRRHLVQLRPILRAVAERNHEQALARSLAEAYRLDQDEVHATLESWWNDALTLQPSGSNSKVTTREALLATVAYTYGAISYSDRSTIKRNTAFGRLLRLLRKEHHPQVRNAALLAVMQITQHDFAGTEQMLQQTLNCVHDHEREPAVERLKHIYVENLRKLTGDSSIFVESVNTALPLWLPPSKPPLTPVERALLRWIKDAKYPIAEQIAVRAIDRIETIKLHVDGHANELAEKKKQEAKEQAEAVKRPDPRFIALKDPDFYQAHVVPLLATVGVWRYASVISTILPEARVRGEAVTTRRNLTSFLKRWIDLKDRDLVVIRRRLRVALWLSDHRLIGMGMVLLLIGMFSYALLQFTAAVVYLL